MRFTLFTLVAAFVAVQTQGIPLVDHNSNHLNDQFAQINNNSLAKGRNEIDSEVFLTDDKNIKQSVSNDMTHIQTSTSVFKSVNIDMPMNETKRIEVLPKTVIVEDKGMPQRARQGSDYE